jgi:glycosyltransferase involved in cell wall biosynthesis
MFDITIITINKNNKSGLLRTQASVKEISLNKKNPKFKLEWLIVDGESTDGSIDVIDQKLADQFIVDNNGIYSAMNKGIESAKGDRLFFLNSGDVVSKNLHLVSEYNKNIMLFFESYYMNRFNKIKKTRQRAPCYGMPSSHQGIVFPKSEIRYNTDYKICADYDYYLQHDVDKEFVPLVESLCEKFGLSFSQPVLIMKEMFMIRKRHCSISTALYFLIVDFIKVIIKSFFNVFSFEKKSVK